MDSGYIPAGVQRTVIDRDGYHCRFCGIPVIWQRAQRAMRDAYPETIRCGGRNVEKHTAFQTLALDFDHIIPRSRGGRNTLEDLVVSCAPCNCGRGNWMLEEVGVMEPRSTQTDVRAISPAFSEWDGLTRVL